MTNNQKPTEINASAQSSGTVINPDVQSEISRLANVFQTAINVNAQDDESGMTVVNPQARNYLIDIPKGTVLSTKYIIESPLANNTGEANLYLCSCNDGANYVAKLYRRQGATKEDIHLALQSFFSPYVARIFETGVWNGYPYEIIPFYKYGSLEGRTFPISILKKDIIPALNYGLKALHSHGIIHKDLKPSNIMVCDDQKSVAIIDFGISSVREGGNTVVVTKTGMTPEYSAPETFRNLFLEESDYYSLGVTIYELYTGHTPYAGLDKDTIEQYVSIQKIPFPKDFPQELESLITGLTYNDITNRKDKSNPNRRWTYEEVARWCRGESIIMPGSQSAPEPVEAIKIPPFTFQYKKYTDLAQLVDALGRDWKNGKRRLYRSLLAEHFRPVNQELASYCMDAEEAVAKNPSAEDIEYFRVLYRLNPRMKAFYWKDKQYESMSSLGTEILNAARSRDAEALNFFYDAISSKLFSIREDAINTDNGERAKKVSAIEANYLVSVNQHNIEGQLEQLFILGYLYSGSKALCTSQKQFESIPALIAYVKQLMQTDTDKFDRFSSELLATKGKRVTPSAQFAAWLTVMGQKSATAHLTF